MDPPLAAPATPTGRSRRPRGVLAVVAITLVQSLLIGLLGALVVGAGDDREVAASLEIARSDVRIAGWLLVALGVAGAAVSIGLLLGSEIARSSLAVMVTLELGSAVYGLVSLEEVRIEAFVSTLISLGVLWLLYGPVSAREHFER